jgi:RNA polymerase-binding protein DksA
MNGDSTVLTRRQIAPSRKAQRLNTIKGCYSPNDLQYFKKILLAMREDALSILRDCHESVHSLEASEQSSDSRQWQMNFIEASAAGAVREEYALIIDRQMKFLGYLEAALKRIDEKRYGICISCNKRIARGRLEAVPHTQLCLTCKDGGGLRHRMRGQDRGWPKRGR